MNTVKLLFWSGIAYGVLLVLVRGVFPSESSPTIQLLGLPLIVVVVIIARDFSQRSTRTTEPLKTASTNRPMENPVAFLSGQFAVAAKSSDSYFHDVVRARLKELLVTKVSLETGLETETVRRALSDRKQGAKLLHDEELYTVLYGPVPDTGQERLHLIEEAMELIGAWKA